MICGNKLRSLACAMWSVLKNSRKNFENLHAVIIDTLV